MENTYLRPFGEYVVRQCSQDDLQAVISINWATLPEHYSDFFFEELLRSSPEAFLVAQHGSQIVGYIMCRIEYGFSNIHRFGFARKGHIVSVAILEQHRRKGLGTTLVQQAMEGMKRRGCPEAYLEVRTSNQPAIRLYEELGFKITSRMEAYYRDGDTAYLMSMSL